MRSTITYVLFVIMSSTQLFGFTVNGLPTQDTITKMITFVKDNKLTRERVTIVGHEAMFEVLQNGGMKLVLDYDTKRVVFTHKSRRDLCFIADLDKQLETLVPLDNIKAALKATNGTMVAPGPKYRMVTVRSRMAFDPNLNPLSADICKALSPIIQYDIKQGVFELPQDVPSVQRRNSNTRKNRRGKPGRPRRWDEVILIGAVMLILL